MDFIYHDNLIDEYIELLFYKKEYIKYLFVKYIGQYL